jgi:hypothetical protein
LLFLGARIFGWLVGWLADWLFFFADLADLVHFTRLGRRTNGLLVGWPF